MINNLIGQRFGKLQVISRVENRGKWKVYFLCLCDCGSYKEIRSENLKSGKTKSCGCVSKLPFGEASFNNLYAKYKNAAMRRGYKFELTKQQFKMITSCSCHYCGQSPNHEFVSCKQSGYTGNYVGNGIDRVDNTKGYVLDNCVPCCEICNKAKRDLGYKDFINWIERIRSFRKDEE